MGVFRWVASQASTKYDGQRVTEGEFIRLFEEVFGFN